MKNSIKLKIAAGLFLGLFLTLLTQMFSYISMRELNNTNKWVSHTYEVLRETDMIQNNVLKIENSVRGFAISNNLLFLDEHDIKVNDLKSSVDRLTRLTMDNAVQQGNILKLKPLMNKRIELAGELIHHTGEVNNSELARTVGEGKSMTDQINQIINSIQDEENRLLVLRIARSNALASRVFFSVLISGVVGFLIVILSVFFIFRDLNRRKELEDEVKENESRLNQFLEALPIGIYVVSTDGKAYYSNTHAKTLMGPSVSTDIKLYITGTDKPYPVEEMPIVKALKGIPSKVDDIYIRKDGQNMLLEVTARPIFNSEEEVVYAIACFSDITSRKKAEEELQQSKELAEQSVKIKESFLANMSHEIRTPMNAVIGFAMLLDKSPLDAEQKQFVEAIRTSGDNLLTVINDILDFSKIEAGMMKLEEIPFSIHSLLESLNVLLSNKAKEKNLSLEVESAANLPDVVMGDPIRITQILINLIGNALKFTEKGGVFVGVMLHRQDKKHSEIRFSVKDTGIGIHPDKVSGIFERFNQASIETSRRYGGTGLGLSIVKNLIDLQGGTIHVESKYGHGSEFYFIIPFRHVSEEEAAAVKAIEEEEEKSFHLENVRVLVAEDNPMNQKLALKVLVDEFGFLAELAGNGQEAVDKMRSGSYDVILMDIQMPEMDGYEATRIIREEMGLTIPIIAMTAHAMSGEREKCLGRGFNEYISKPFKPKNLYNIIGMLLHRHKTDDSVTQAEQRKEPSTGKVTDLSYLEELSSGSEEFVQEMISTFLEHMPGYVDTLRKAYNEKRWDELRAIAHKMNSPISMIGISTLVPVIKEIEENALNRANLEGIGSMVDTTVKLCNLAIEELRNELK